MKRILTGALLLGLVLLVAGAATTPTTPAKPKVTKSEPYDHLLMLDIREAAEHAKTLHHYASMHGKDLDKAVVDKHVAELDKNVGAIETELTDVEKNVPEGDKTKVETHLTTIRTEEQKAKTDLDELKTETAKPTMDPKIVAEKSKGIYEAMSTAREHHGKAMMKRGVHEPAAPTKP